MRSSSSSPKWLWDADLADVQLISKFNKRFQLLLCIIDIYSIYAWKKFFSVDYNAIYTNSVLDFIYIYIYIYIYICMYIYTYTLIKTGIGS